MRRDDEDLGIVPADTLNRLTKQLEQAEEASRAAVRWRDTVVAQILAAVAGELRAANGVSREIAESNRQVVKDLRPVLTEQNELRKKMVERVEQLTEAKRAYARKVMRLNGQLAALKTKKKAARAKTQRRTR